MKRRGLFVSALAVAGGLTVGWSLLPQRSRLGPGKLLKGGLAGVALNGWIKIAADGGVILAMPRSEMGQGVHTALQMLAAEELDVPLDGVRIEQAGADSIYGNVAMLVANLPFHPREAEGVDGFGRVRASRWIVGKLARELGINATGGSSSVSDAWDVVRLAAATARASLLGAASLQWKLPVEELSVRDGVISHGSGKFASYGTLVRFAAATPPGTVRVKSHDEFRLIGRSLPRTDIPAKVDGSARFGLDVRLPGMRYAVVRLCPMLGGAPGRIDSDAVIAMAGVERVVMLPAYAGSTAGFAVVAKTSWNAWQAALAVPVDWQQRPLGALNSRRVEADLEAAVRSALGHVFYEQGDVAAAEAGGRVIEAWYRAPFLAHATLEPMNCTAQVREGGVQIWAPTQVPGLARAIAARVAGVPEANVQIHTTLLGGGFGRRLEVDFVAQAVRVALDCGGAPVQLMWPREEDQGHDFYRPMQVAMLQAAFDGEGQISSLRIKSAGDAVSPRWIERAMPALAAPIDSYDKTTAEGLFDQPYEIPNQRMEHVAVRTGVPVGYWRSVGHSHNAFFGESFIDELAVAAGQDPVEFRRALLVRSPRHLAVLDLAAKKSGWGASLAPGRARGIALHESFGSVVAQVAEVSISSGIARVHRVTCAIDCGTVVNPDIVAQQMEGSVVFALSAALHGRIDIVDGVVQQTNFPSYSLLPLAHGPNVDTWLVASRRAPSGVGEPGVPPLAPAVANALFALNGKRLRSLPFAI
jgi:isoquinoline 1-oxidoreductase beta subunit